MSHSSSWGWVLDLPDHREKRFEASRKILRKLPSSVIFIKFCHPVYTQDHMNSCTAHAIGAAYLNFFIKIRLLFLVPWLYSPYLTITC
ncbi:MAG: hypothetical protein ACOVMQ_02795 [Cyclobacteriaceae bacterium]